MGTREKGVRVGARIFALHYTFAVDYPWFRNAIHSSSHDLMCMHHTTLCSEISFSLYLCLNSACIKHSKNPSPYRSEVGILLDMQQIE